jgi:hypothetical protein
MYNQGLCTYIYVGVFAELEFEIMGQPNAEVQFLGDYAPHFRLQYTWRYSFS